MKETIEHRQIRNGDIDLHVASCGTGPLVVLCHGFPGLWYSWRKQLPALAQAGYQAVAMDMRGYGASSRPTAVADYGLAQTSTDVLAVIEHFGVENEKAVVIGHDFGANLAWHLSVHHRDRVRAIVSLCVPYGMALAGGVDVLPSSLYAQVAEQHFFHMHYYQQPGVAEASCRGRESEFLQKLFWALCAEGELLSWENYPAEGTAYIDVLAEPPTPPPWRWLSAEDFDYYLSQYMSAGPELTFAGGANAYRAMDENWRAFGPTANAKVEIPAMYIGGAEDPTVSLGGPDQFDVMDAQVLDLRGRPLIPGAGHFLQQEQPEALKKHLLAFLNDL